MNEKEFAKGIVEQAIEDYKKVLLGYRVRESATNFHETEKLKKECERFFMSEWGELLSGISGVWIMEKIKETEYGNLIKAYEKALEGNEFRFSVRFEGDKKKHEVKVPPILVDEIKEVLRNQIERLKKEI